MDDVIARMRNDFGRVLAFRLALGEWSAADADEFGLAIRTAIDAGYRADRFLGRLVRRAGRQLRRPPAPILARRNRRHAPRVATAHRLGGSCLCAALRSSAGVLGRPSTQAVTHRPGRVLRRLEKPMSSVPFSWMWRDPAEVLDRLRPMRARMAVAEKELKSASVAARRRIRKLVKLAKARMLKGRTWMISIGSRARSAPRRRAI